MMNAGVSGLEALVLLLLPLGLLYLVVVTAVKNGGRAGILDAHRIERREAERRVVHPDGS